MFDKSVHPMVARLLEPLRSSPLYAEQQIILAAQFVAWVAAASRLSDALRPQPKLMTAEGVASVFKELRQQKELDQSGTAFMAEDSALRSVRDMAFMQLWHEAQALLDRGFIGPRFAGELLGALVSGAGRSGLLLLPKELVQLLVGLARLESGIELYTPFDESLQISLEAAASGARVFSEVSHASPLPHLVNLIAGQTIEVPPSHNLLSHPAYTSGTALRTFPRAIAAPPFGWRVTTDFVSSDLYDRFREKTNSGTVLAVRHVMAQTTERIVLLTTNGLLSGAGADRAVREDLVHAGLEAVISLPSALLAMTSVSLSILVVNRHHTGAGRTILFVDGSAPRFHKRDGKGRTTLSGWADLLQVSLGRGETGEQVFPVSLGEVIENDYQLLVSRYARSDVHDPVAQALARYPAQALEDLVEFIRPMVASSVAEDSAEPGGVAEVGGSDLPEFGYVRPPQKRVSIDNPKGELQAGDLLLTVKGNVGKVGIVPPDSVERWVPGQSLLALRVKRGAYAPEALLLYLRSPIGQDSLKRISSGAAVSLIQLRELRKLQVPVPPVQVQQQAVQAFRAIAALQDQIDNLRNQQARAADSVWETMVTGNDSGD